METNNTTPSAPAPAAASTNQASTPSSPPAREHREHREHREPREGGRPQRGRKGRKKVCSFCVDRIYDIDYKDVPRLRRYLSERSKIIPRRVTGTCARHQRQLTRAIKRARHIAFLPYVSD